MSTEEPNFSLESTENAFRMIDVDGDGVVTVQDLGAFLDLFQLRPTQKELFSLLSRISEGEELDLESFSKFLNSNTSEEGQREALLAVFNLFDLDGNGVIDSEELCDALAKMGEGDLSRAQMNLILQTADKESTGTISFEEFYEALKL